MNGRMTKRVRVNEWTDDQMRACTVRHAEVYHTSQMSAVRDFETDKVIDCGSGGLLNVMRDGRFFFFF